MRAASIAVLASGAAVVALLGCSSKSVTMSPGAAGTKGGAGGAAGGGGAGSAGSGVAGTGAAGTGTAGTGAAGSGVAGTGVAGSGTAGTGAAGSGAAGTGNGTAGTGAAGSGAAGATGAAGLADVGLGFQDTSASVLTRNKHETRDGFFIQPTLTLANASKLKGDIAFSTAATFTGNLMGSPLYMENGPAAKGAFFVATTSNDVYALDETTGATVWKHNIGVAPAKTGVACGNVAPVGIISTPVIDAASRTIFVAGAVGDATTILRHEVHALDVDTGAERAGWPVNVSALTSSSGKTFKSAAQNQRGALSLVNGILYVPYGGHAGDCDEYRGWVVAIRSSDPTKVSAWATGGIGEAIWTPGGMASAGDGVLAVTGNNMEGAAVHLDSEEVVHVRGMAVVDRATGIFFPGSWRAMDQADLDFGSSSGVVFNVPGSTPSTIMAAVTKNGLFYLLNPANLGGMDGHLAQLTVTENKVSVKTVPVAYRTTEGIYVLFSAQNAAAFCPGGTVPAATHAAVAVKITPGSPPTAKVAWCSGGSPMGFMVTTSDGIHDAIAWINSSGYIYGLEGDTGATHYGTNDYVCPVNTMTSPIAVKGRLIFGSNGKLCSYSPH